MGSLGGQRLLAHLGVDIGAGTKTARCVKSNSFEPPGYIWKHANIFTL